MLIYLFALICAYSSFSINFRFTNAMALTIIMMIMTRGMVPVIAPGCSCLTYKQPENVVHSVLA